MSDYRKQYFSLLRQTSSYF